MVWLITKTKPASNESADEICQHNPSHNTDKTKQENDDRLIVAVREQQWSILASNVGHHQVKKGTKDADCRFDFLFHDGPPWQDF